MLTNNQHTTNKMKMYIGIIWALAKVGVCACSRPKIYPKWWFKIYIYVEKKKLYRKKSGMYKNVLVQFYFAESLQQQSKIAQVSFLSLLALSHTHYFMLKTVKQEKRKFSVYRFSSIKLHRKARARVRENM